MRSACLVLLAGCLWGCQMQSTELPEQRLPPVATFSIVAFDPDTGELGVAAQSKFIAVGAVVPWAAADVGAVATQAEANTTYGPDALKRLAAGEEPEKVLANLLAGDKGRQHRQVGIVDAKGRAANFTGKRCHPWAGGRTGGNYCVQGNILAGPQVVAKMAEAFEAARGDLGERMIASLAAGQAAGGDRRGRQAAALLIVRKGGGYGARNDRYRDLRVDDHKEPVKELLRIYRLHKQAFPPPQRRRRR